MRGHRHHHRLVLAVLAQEVDADLQVRPFHLAIDRLADIVEERGADRDVGVEAHFPGHDAGEPRDLGGVGQHVLPVAGSVLQPAHQPQDLRVEVVEAELERDGRPFLAHRLVGLFLHFLDDLFDARRMNAAVGDQALDGLLGDLAAIRIETRQDDGAGRVVDDQVDPGGELERADVAALAADDASLQIVARQIDDRHGRLDRVFRAAALDGFGDVVLGAVDRRFARFGVEPLEQVGRVVARLAFDLLEQQLLGLVGREAGDPLELVLLLGDEPLVLGGRGGRRLLALADRPVARAQFLVEAIDADLALRQRRFAAGQRLFERRGRLLRLAAPGGRRPSAARAPFPWLRGAPLSCASRRRARRL